MNVAKRIRKTARRILGPGVTGYLRRRFAKTVAGLDFYKARLGGGRGLEIGGPSTLFGEAGILPIYQGFESLDNCIYSTNTIWTGNLQEGRSFHYHPSKPAGTQFICDATDLKPIETSSYDSVLASHCLEHVANPIRALREWKRVLRPDGLLLLVLPHKDGTFDWRRPTTSLAHMVEDYCHDVGEDDLSHLSEILELHDLQRDEAAGSRDNFHRRCLQNFSNRAMHQHVFNTPTALRLVDYIGLQVIRVDVVKPFHIIILAQHPRMLCDNAAFLGSSSNVLDRSPFPSDRLNKSLTT